jgi:hypothetical protein
MPEKLVNVFKAFMCIIQGVDRELKPPGGPSGMEKLLSIRPDQFMDFFVVKWLSKSKDTGLKSAMDKTMDKFKNKQIESHVFEMAQRYTDKLQTYYKECE